MAAALALLLLLLLLLVVVLLLLKPRPPVVAAAAALRACCATIAPPPAAVLPWRDGAAAAPLWVSQEGLVQLVRPQARGLQPWVMLQHSALLLLLRRPLHHRSAGEQAGSGLAPPDQAKLRE